MTEYFTNIIRHSTEYFIGSASWTNTTFDRDHLSLFYAKNKNDPAGLNKDPKAIYGNPQDPRVCVFLALGIYFLCNPILDEHFFFGRGGGAAGTFR